MALEGAKEFFDLVLISALLNGMRPENTVGGAVFCLCGKYTKDLTGVDIAVTGMAGDQALTNRPGTCLGLRVIRRSSALQSLAAPCGWRHNRLSTPVMTGCGGPIFDIRLMRRASACRTGAGASRGIPAQVGVSSADCRHQYQGRRCGRGLSPL